MKIPAIRAKMPEWTYYVTTLTFQQVNDFVQKVDQELHSSPTLNDLIQRSITNNYVSIKNYILNQPEMFFNSLILAVYNDYPTWQEIKISYDDEEVYQIGLLDFPGNHKIFPVDGQHRVEGIKAALRENPELSEVKISAIFIGHKSDLEGLRKTRRLFSTLNRYAKPVTMDDIIALDEDDIIAICTRRLLEEFDLFMDSRVTKSNNKAILENDKSSFTSIITLYQCNKEILKLFRSIRKVQVPLLSDNKKSIEEYLKIRPHQTEIELYMDLLLEFWNSLKNQITTVNNFVLNNNPDAAREYRNRENGGVLLFRPIGLLPFVQASIEIKKRRHDQNFDEIMRRFNQKDLSLNSVPWKMVLWNPYEHTMIMNNSLLVKILFMYIYDQTILNDKEEKTLRIKYPGKLNYDGDISELLRQILDE